MKIMTLQLISCIIKIIKITVEEMFRLFQCDKNKSMYTRGQIMCTKGS